MNRSRDLGSFLGWTIWGLGALFYAYAYFQRVAPSVMTSELMREFDVTAAALGNLSAFYFYPYALLQIPLGMMIDRLGPRRAILAAAALCTIGSFLFALTPSVTGASLGRLLIGAGASISWVGTLALAMHWLPARRFATVTGLTLLFGLVGAVIGQAPLAALMTLAGWRDAMLGAAVVMLIVAGACLVLVRDHDAGMSVSGPRPGVLASLLLVLRDRQAWKVAIFTGFMVTPMAAFAGLWGVPFVVQAYGLDVTAAGASVSLILVGWAIGGPLAGWISDRLQRRRPVMATGCAMVITCWLLLLGVEAPLWVFQVLLLVNGLASGAIILNFAAIRDIVATPVVAAAMGLVNMIGMGFSALALPLLGLLLDWQWQGVVVDGVRQYSAEAYRNAFWCFPASMIVSFTAILMLRPGSRGR
ncbi:MAG: MFS transporter [Alphaproteobacteria bacterium]|nr:MFS transporter [Alphaproteobacteria bacterium]